MQNVETPGVIVLRFFCTPRLNTVASQLKSLIMMAMRMQDTRYTQGCYELRCTVWAMTVKKGSSTPVSVSPSVFVRGVCSSRALSRALIERNGTLSLGVLKYRVTAPLGQIIDLSIRRAFGADRFLICTIYCCSSCCRMGGV